MVASKTSVIFAAVALGAVSTYAIPTSFDRNLVRRAGRDDSGLAPRDLMAAAAAASASNSTTGGASDIAVAAVSSTSDNAKPRYSKHKDQGYESGEEGHKAVAAVSSTSDEAKPRPRKHKDEGYESGEEGHKDVEGHHRHHKGHHKGHHRHHHHHHHDDEELFELAFNEGFEVGFATGLIESGMDGDHHGKHHHGHHGHGHHHHHHHGHHPHGEEPAEASAKASVNETVTVQTEATLQPSHPKRSFNSILRRDEGDSMTDGPTDATMTSESYPGSGRGGDKHKYQQQGGQRTRRRRKPHCKFIGQRHCRPYHSGRPRQSDSGRRQRGPDRSRQSPQGAEVNAADASQPQDVPPPSDVPSDGPVDGASPPLAKRNWKRDLAHGLGLEDEFFMKRAYEEDEFMY